jgi:hypothetical protein
MLSRYCEEGLRKTTTTTTTKIKAEHWVEVPGEYHCAIQLGVFLIFYDNYLS